jgi:spermidine synthase
MRDWELIDTADVPEDDATLYLVRRGSEHAIHVDGRELMTNRLHGSEDALADLACDRLEDLDRARILVGGLGMGFTLSAALRRIGPEGRATVAELIPAVVRWNREYVGGPSRHPLRDPRVSVHVGDVAGLIDDAFETWSAVLLDVDNGPTALTRVTNGWLYTREGLAAVRRALIPGGVLGVWSAATDRPFTRRLKSAGFEVELVQHTEARRPSVNDDGTHYVWLARRRPDIAATPST